MALERDLVLERDGKFAPKDRDEILSQLRDSMIFIVDESCDKFGEDEIIFNNSTRGEEIYITRNRDENLYEMGIRNECIQEAFICSALEPQKTFYFVSHRSNHDQPLTYQYSLYPEIAFKQISRVVSIVTIYFNDETLGMAYDFLQESES